MIYLIKKDQGVRVFYSEAEMKKAGYSKADKTVMEEEFNSNGCYARVINGKIVVGKTPEERAAEEKQGQIAEIMGEFEQLDRESGATREVRDVSLSAGVVLDAVRVLMARFSEKLEVSLPKDFGKGTKTGAEILALVPPDNATEEEIDDFEVHKALLLVKHFDPAINEGLKRMHAAEKKAIQLRIDLEELK